MALADILVIVATILYFAIGGAFVWKGNYPLALVYAAYGVANFGVLWVSLLMGGRS